MPRPPAPAYATNVIRAPDSFWRRGWFVVVFVGPDAWGWGKDFLASGEALEARHRFTLVCPPQEDPAGLSWPVRGRRVVVVDTGADEDYLGRLFETLQRAGATEGHVIEACGMQAWELALSLFQGFAHHDLHAVAEDEEARDARRREMLMAFYEKARDKDAAVRLLDDLSGAGVIPAADVLKQVS